MAKRKKINSRVLLVLVVLGVIVVGFATAFVVQQLPKDPAAEMKIVEEEVAKSKPDWNNVVFRHLGQAIRYTTDDQAAADLLYRQAELHFEMLRREPDLSAPQQDEQRSRGWQALEQAVRRDPRHLKARRRLAELRGALAQFNAESSKAWQDYIAELDGILALAPEDAESYFHRGRAYAQLATTEPKYQQNAVEDFRKAVECDKKKVEYWDVLAQYLASQQRTAEAEQVFREAIQANPDKALPRVGYARFLRSQKRLEEAQKMIQQAIQCEPNNPMGYIDQSGELLQKKQYDQAEAVLKKAQSIAKSDPQVYAQFVTLYKMKQDLPAADRVLREGLALLDQEDAQADPQDKEGAFRRGNVRAVLNYLLAEVLLDRYGLSKDQKEKEKLLAEAKNRHRILLTLAPNQTSQYQIEGRIAYHEQRWAEAREALEKVVQQDPTPRTAMMLLTIYRQLGIPGQSEKLAEYYLKERRLPPSVQLLFLLELAQLRINLSEYDKAQELVNQARSIDPNHEIVKELQQALDVYRGKTTQALAQGGERGNVARAMLFRRVQDLILNDQTDQAQEVLEKMLHDNPHDLEALARLLGLLMENHKQDQALEWVAKARALEPDNQDIQRFEALLKEPSADKRYEIEMQFVERAPVTDKKEDKFNKALQKWSVAARYGKTQDAQKYLEEAEAIDPDNAIVVELRFREALADQKWSQAEELIERIPEGETGYQRDLQRGRLAIARGMAEKTAGDKQAAEEQFTQGLSYLQKVVSASPHLPIPRLLMAECYKELGKREEARKQYRECYENNRQNLPAIVGLAQIAHEAGRFDERNRWIEEAYQLPAGKTDPFVREQYFQILESDPRNLREVIHKREVVLKQDPDNLSNAFRLATLYEKSRQITRAQEMIEYIYQRTPNKLSIAPMLADLYLRINQPGKADEMFSDLLKNAKTAGEKVSVRIAYADFLARSDEAAAVRMYEKAMEEEGPEGTQAIQALSNFKATQAQLAASRGLRDQSRAKWNESIELMRTLIERRQAALRAQLSDEQRTEQEKLLKTARLDLLRRYTDSEQYEQAVAGYQELIQADSEDAQARLGLGLTYLRNDQLDEAEEQFTEVIKLQPELADAYLYRSRVYQSRMDLSKAASDMATCASLTGNIEQKMSLARIYEAMGDDEQAARTYDGIRADNPEYFGAYEGLLNLLRRQKKWSALEEMAKKGMDVFPDAPAFAMVLASAAEEQGDRETQRHWLERAADTAPDNPGVVRQYWLFLLKNRDYVRLQREAEKFGRRPSQTFGAQAVLTAAQARQDPAGARPFQAMLSLLRAANAPADVFFLGQLLEEAYGTAKIVSTASDILTARPDDPAIYSFLGDACLQEKKYRQAEQFYQEAMKRAKSEPAKVPVYLRLAQLYDREGAYPKVEAQYQAVLKDNPTHRLALNNLAYTYIEYLNRPEEGLKLIQRAMKATPGDPNLMDTYAWALAKLERFEEARAIFEKIAGVGGSGGAERLYHMGFVLEKTGSLDEAYKYYRQALEVARAQQQTILQTTIETAAERVRQQRGKE